MKYSLEKLGSKSASVTLADGLYLLGSDQRVLDLARVFFRAQGKETHVPFPFPSHVSGLHAVLDWRGNRGVIYDCGSRRGVFLEDDSEEWSVDGPLSGDSVLMYPQLISAISDCEGFERYQERSDKLTRDFVYGGLSIRLGDYAFLEIKEK